jgi:hypothetical protein
LASDFCSSPAFEARRFVLAGDRLAGARFGIVERKEPVSSARKMRCSTRSLGQTKLFIWRIYPHSLSANAIILQGISLFASKYFDETICYIITHIFPWIFSGAAIAPALLMQMNYRIGVLDANVY